MNVEERIDIGDRLDKQPKVVFRELGEGKGGVLLHLVTGQYYALNGTGALIWNLLDGRRTIEDVVGEVRARRQNTPVGLADEVIRFIRHLQERGLIATLPVGAGPTATEGTAGP